MRRALWILLTPTVTLLVMGFIFNRVFAPGILRFATNKIESLSKEQGPFLVKIQKSRLQYFPPGVVAESVTLSPKPPLSTSLSDIQVQTAKAELAMFPLLTGKLSISLVELESPSVQVNVQLKAVDDKPSEFSPAWDWSPLFEKIQSFPFEQIIVKNLNLKVFERKSQVGVSFFPTDLQLLQLTDLIQARLSIPNVSASWDKRERLKTELELLAFATPKSLQIQRFVVKNQTLDFALSGEMKNKKGKALDAKVLWKGVLNLDQVQNTLEQIFPEKKFPTLLGELQAQGSWSPTQKDLFRADFRMETKNVKVAKFSVGDALVSGTLSQRSLLIRNLQVQHPAGDLELQDTRLGLGEGFPLSSRLHLKSLDLQKLFQSLNLKTIPVEAWASGTAPCQGQLVPLKFSCKFETKLKDMQVRAGFPKDSFELVRVQEAQAQGDLKVDLKEASFHGGIQVGTSKGAAEGRVDFRKGFEIKFQTPELHWSDIQNLASLNLTGHAALTGETRGTTESATLLTHVKTRQQGLDGFYLGDTEFDLSFEKGQLNVQNLKGKIDQTEYAGQAKIDFKAERVSAQITSSKANLKDIKSVIEKRIPVPLDLEGLGTIAVKANGPLSFWRLDTEVSGRFTQVQMGHELFNDLKVDISSEGGLYRLNKVEARRSGTLLSVEGTLSPQQDLKLQGQLRNALLEESDWIARIGWPLSGKLNAQMKLEGTLENPDLLVSGQFSEMILDENEVPNSNFRFEIQNHRALAEGAFFGHQVQANLVWPLDEKGSGNTLVRVKTQDWDYTPWLSLFNAGAINEETQGRLSCDVSLNSKTGRWDDLSGSMKIPELMIARHDLVLQNPRPILIEAQQGAYTFQNFVLRSEGDGRVEIFGDNVSSQNLQMKVNVSSDLKLAQIFAPVFDEISGPIDFQATLGGSVTKPQMVGQMRVRNGYFRIKGFPHAFEKMKLDATFSQTRILINEVQGQLGGGRLKGEGSIQIQGPEDVPILFRAKAEDISLNVPDQVKTKGDADLTLSGRWFPYTLGGTYRIKSTLVEMGFGGQTMGAQLRQNHYLPQDLKEKISSPLNFDLQLLFQKPIQVKNSFVDAQATGQLTIKGTLNQPVLIGQLKTQKGSYLFFKDKPFEIQSAAIQFQNPNEINPELFISAQTRIEAHDVTLLVQGSAKDPNIRLSSQPPLTENDLTSLLALGVTSSQLQTVDQREQQSQTASEVFAAAFQSTGVAKKLQSATGFNVQISNSFDTTRNISVPKFTVSRKLNKKTNATVAFPIAGDQKTPEGRIQYNLSDTFSVNGSYEVRKFDQNATIINQREVPSILGVDLEFKREFK
ncbi:MAG: translocation/assembly module TamB domain-containing protein [Bdellovibrionales bacterium]